MQELGFIKFFPENIWPFEDQFCWFSQSTECLILIFALCCCSATAVAEDLILVELDGELHSLFHNPFSFGLNFDQALGGILWPVCPMVLRMRIHRSGRDFVGKPLSVFLLDKVLLTVAKACQLPVLLVCCSLGNGSPLLLLPISRVIPLQSLILWDCIFDQVFQVT